GESWTRAFRVADFPGDGGYPSSVQLPDGRVLTAFYARRTDGHDRYHMGTVTWDPAASGVYSAEVEAPSYGTRIYPAAELVIPTRAGFLYQVQSSRDGTIWTNHGRHFMGTGEAVRRLLP